MTNYNTSLTTICLYSGTTIIKKVQHMCTSFNIRLECYGIERQLEFFVEIFNKFNS